MKLILVLLGTIIAAASTFVGTCVAYILFRLFVFRMDFRWWADFPISVGFYVVWHWGGFFLSGFLVGLCQEIERKDQERER